MGDDGDKFIWIVKNGEKNSVEELITKGRDVNAQVSGRFPLHYAADYGQRDIIKVLLDKGANINAKDKFEITPLLAAIFEGHTDCVKLLLSRGADKTGKSPSGDSYIECAEKQDIKNLLK